MLFYWNDKAALMRYKHHYLSHVRHGIGHEQSDGHQKVSNLTDDITFHHLKGCAHKKKPLHHCSQIKQLNICCYIEAC
jgi:hypothetical protein